MHVRPRLRRLAFATAALSALLVPTVPAVAADPGCTRYAARTGNDANAGTETAPKLTAQALINSLKAGETGCLRGGIYNELNSSGYVARFDTPGTASAPITLRSYAGERARLVGIVTVNAAAAHVHLRDLDIEGTGTANTVKIYAPDVRVEDNDITNVNRGQSCMMLGSNSGAGQATRVVVAGNVLHDCGNPANGNKDHAIYASNVDGGSIVDNVFANPSAYAIQLYPNADNTRFAHNVIDGGASIRGGVLFGGDTNHTSSNNVVEHNIVTSTATYAVTTSWSSAGVGSGNVARSNCFYDNASGALGGSGYTASSNLTADPQFKAAAARDYRLSTLSPCLPVVGYDTAAKLLGELPSIPTPMPAPEPTPEATPAPEPAPAPAPSPDPTPAPAPAPAPVPAPDGSSSGAGVNLAPTVRLTEPVDGGRAGNPLRMSADARDDHGVVKVEFYVAGKLRATDSSAPFSVSWKAPKNLAGSAQTVVAKAYDTAGLATTDQVSAVLARR